MRVAAADFSYKVQKETPNGGGATGQKGGGSSNMREKKKIIKKTQKLNSKLADWDDDDPQQSVEASSRWDKVVILKHMFTLDELSEDPAAILDIKEDIRGQWISPSLALYLSHSFFTFPLGDDVICGGLFLSAY